MEQYLHSYKGLVISNSDPEFCGRVKVFVPSISMTLYEGWNKDRNTDKKFTTLGGNLASSITPEILQRLKESLPWAQVKHPIFGMGTNMTYHNDKDFSEKSNDADSSHQQIVTNKQNSCSLPENNKSSMSSALKSAATSSSNNNSTPINTNSTPNQIPSYIQNAIIPNDDSKPATITAQTNNNHSPITPNNTSEIIISYVPEYKDTNNLNKTFTSSVSTPVPKPSYNDNIISYSPPITYNTVFHKPVDGAVISFVPIKNNNETNGYKKVSSTKSDVSYDGNIFSIKDENNKTNPIKINKDTIQGISINHTSDFTTIELSNKDILGETSKLFEEYSTSSSGVSTTAIAPPAPIKVAECNSGGGGNSLLAMSAFSNLLPFNVFLATMIGNTNPDSKQGINHKRQIDNGTDPNKRVGSNQQSSADGIPPFRSEDQNNKVKGLVSIPAVGAHVNVIFENGNPLFPIVDGIFYSQEEFAGIYDIAK